MAQAFGPVSESTVFTNAGSPTATAICIFVHKHSAMAAAGVPVLARRGEPLARRFLTIFGPQARIKCYEPAGLEEGLLSHLPRRGAAGPTLDTPSTGRTQSTAWSDVVPPRRAEEEEVKVLARRALRLLSGEDLDGGPAASCPSVSDRELRRRFSVGRPVAAVFSGDSSSEESSDVSEDEGCAQQ
ncbi:hypothetical protein FOZ60_012018 [Perkinsus olseni]|uniref:Uncharacterized protein n=1 Tax=Perkinsus olseni TaxID=32597 RepID=A0A7J6PAX0_PEROL|nr:hypothetical protein FOZ60_012018 [Perkinsus olseni]